MLTFKNAEITIDFAVAIIILYLHDEISNDSNHSSYYWWHN